MLKNGLIALLVCGLVYACATTPVSEKQALILVPFAQEVSLGEQAFEEILQKEALSTNRKLSAMVEKVGRRIARETSMADLDWEFKLFESQQMNAFALPGGKVGVYTGILQVCANEAGLAAVLGHEIAHAVARHGAQRMSQQILVTGALAATSVSLANNKDRRLILGALGVGTLYGVSLPFSRSNESEADEIGVVYMARAGYDPQEAMRFWQRFSNMKQGAQTPEFLSTHPADERRIHDIEKLLPNAMKVYRTHPNPHGLGESFLYALNEERLKAPSGNETREPSTHRGRPSSGGGN